MADRSDHGWVTIEEYLEADNCDDERKCMQESKYEAGRKVKNFKKRLEMNMIKKHVNCSGI